MTKLKIGWAGLGNMGNPMAKNLLKAGFDLTVYNRNKVKEKEVTDAGAVSAENPAALMEKCDVVITMLSNDDAVKSVFEGPDGLLTNPLAGNLLIDMSTVSPETSRYLSAICLKQGIEFLEAPVSGSVKPAQDGTLIILAAGNLTSYEKAKPVFDKLGKLSLYLGAAGFGSTAKLAINYLLGTNLLAIAETVKFAHNNGITKENMLTIINESACGNVISKLKTPSILHDAYPAAFALKHLSKDLRLAKEAHIDSVLIDPLLTSYQDAEKHGLGEEDCMAIMKWIEK